MLKLLQRQFHLISTALVIKHKMRSENGEVYTTGKNITLPPALTGWTNSTSDSSLFLDLDISRLVVDHRDLGHVRVPRILARAPASQLLRVLVRRELLQTYSHS